MLIENTAVKTGNLEIKTEAAACKVFIKKTSVHRSFYVSSDTELDEVTLSDLAANETMGISADRIGNLSCIFSRPHEIEQLLIENASIEACTFKRVTLLRSIHLTRMAFQSMPEIILCDFRGRYFEENCSERPKAFPEGQNEEDRQNFLALSTMNKKSDNTIYELNFSELALKTQRRIIKDQTRENARPDLFFEYIFLYMYDVFGGNGNRPLVPIIWFFINIALFVQLYAFGMSAIRASSVAMSSAPDEILNVYAHAAMHMLIHMFDFQKLFSMEMFSNTPAPLVPFLFIGFFCNWYLILLVLWGVKKRLGY